MPIWLSSVPCFWKGDEKDLFVCLVPLLPPLFHFPPFLHVLSHF